MPKASIQTLYNKSIHELNVLTAFIAGSSGMDVKYQYLVSEVVMVRLFSIYENLVPDMAYRLACGAKYRNGRSPLVLSPCSSISNANAKMLSYNRSRALPYLKWTTSAYINNSIMHVLNTSDNFYSQILLNNSSLDEMRHVRNHIAHRTSGTGHHFKNVLLTRYGAIPKISVGAYLTSTSRHPMSNINRYLQMMRIIIGDITQG